MSRARSFSKLINKDNYATYSGSDSVTDISAVSLPQGTLGFRNRIINGDMRIDQRNAGASVTGYVFYTLDRWIAIQAGTTNRFSVQQNAGAVTPPVGFTNYLGVVSLSAHSLVAGDYYQIKQSIEGFNVADFDWGTANARSITVSFWVRSSLTGDFGVVVSWGSSGANQRAYPILYSITSANTWEYKTITIPGDTTMAAGGFETGNGGGVQLRFSLGGWATSAGTSGSWAAANFQTVIGDTSVVSTNGATFYITGVQLEEGTVPTPFEHRPYGTELALCQRYYYTCSRSGYMLGRGNGTTALTDLRIPTPVPMRTSPTITDNSGTWYVIDADSYTNGTGATFSIGNFSANHLIVQVGNLTGLTDNRVGMISLFSGYSLDAEL